MLKAELIDKSPLRILEKSTQGGLGIGNVGVIAGPKGTGKTACLVHIATDQLFQNKPVIHISFSDDASHIVAWYEDIFSEVARRSSLEGALEMHDSLMANRLIMYFQQHEFLGVDVEKRLRSVVFDGNFKAETVVIDGYDFSKATVSQLKEIRRCAQDLGLSIWFSATALQQHPMSVPAVLVPSISELAVIITLAQKADYVRLDLIKDHDSLAQHDLHLRLDPKTLLMCGE